MGYSSLIDILGSIVIGGLLLLTMLRINANQTENTIVYGSDRVVQRNLVEVAVLLETELRKIGYCADPNKITSSTKVVQIADSNRIKFLADFNRDGSLDSVYYFLGSTSELNYTPNPRDRILYRQINGGTPAAASYGITEFKLLYFDALNDTLNFPINDPAYVKSLQVSFKIEDGAAYDNQYSSSYWRLLRMSSRNLSNR
jgi:hypothetical protein